MNGKVKKFHQFVKVEKGPINAALIDLLKGGVYQVENGVIAALEQGRYEDIPEFMESALEENLIIDVDEKSWLPPCGEDDFDAFNIDFLEREFNIELHIEEGIDLEAVLEKLKYHNIYRVVFYGREVPQIPNQQPKIVRKEKDFDRCVKQTCVTGDFDRVTEPGYKFNKRYNSCWGEKLAVTREGKVRPCIHSSIAVGDIMVDDIKEILEKMDKYWTLSKDKINKCKDCELRHVCFDCREVAYRHGGDLFSAQPNCSYDPYKGTWEA